MRPADDLCDRGGRDGEAQQFDLGEGPSYTAHRTGRPVLVPDLARDDRWPAFAEAAAASGLCAFFGFPLRSGSGSLGTLTLYRHAVGELTAEQYADALVVARFAFGLLTSLQAGGPRDELDQVFADTLSGSREVLQASGVASVQLGVSVGSALAVLRAHAFAESCSLSEVATQVIDRRLKFSDLRQ